MESFVYPSEDWGVAQVCLNNSMLRYTIAAPPEQYFRRGIIRPHIRLQMDGDGLISILRSSEEFPLETSSSQPEGYPLKPERVGAC
jgi:hypothetical protein